MQNNPHHITILVSLYGDSPYLKAFLDSLARQSLQDFRLLYRFDGVPSEAVRKLIGQYAFAEALHGEAFAGIPATYWQLLLADHDSKYLMFADQDDIWHPDKVEKSFAAIRKQEEQYGSNTPLLVHSDLIVTDAENRLISRSFFRYQSLKPERTRMKDLMIQNNVTGCTIIINRALAKLMTRPVPSICHDWYLAMAAAAFGKIGVIREPLMDYRQHSANHFGAVPAILLSPRKRCRKNLHERLGLTQQQALLFLEEFRDRLSPGQTAILEAWGKNLTDPVYCRRLWNTLKHGFRKNDLLRTLGMWWAL